MIQIGTALKIQAPPYHRCLIISDPVNNGGHVVLVRVPSDDGTWPDHDCILTPSEWGELEHDSTMAYTTCKFGRVVPELEAALKRGEFEVISSPSKAVLRKVIAAAQTALGMPCGAKALLARI